MREENKMVQLSEHIQRRLGLRWTFAYLRGVVVAFWCLPPLALGIFFLGLARLIEAVR